MIYQIFYDDKIVDALKERFGCVKTFGVNKAKLMSRIDNCLYDDEQLPNLTEHNTLCEWRVLYYIWKHHPSKWVGFTSWQHDQKKFFPKIEEINELWVHTVLKHAPIKGLIVRPLSAVMIKEIGESGPLTLKNQFLQWSMVENVIEKKVNDIRGLPLGCYHSPVYWDFVNNAFRNLYGPNLEKDLDWVSLGQVTALHTWCNAFVTRWEYFDGYMTMFSPIVLSLLEYFGSHPTDLELSYICERLIVIYNYIRYSNNDFC